MGTRMKVKLLEVDEETERLVFSNRRASSETQMAGHKVRARPDEAWRVFAITVPESSFGSSLELHMQRMMAVAQSSISLSCAAVVCSTSPHLFPQLLNANPVSCQVGDVVVGTVQAVKPYGAFIDVGGLNGLLHISQISHDRVTNVENVLSEGDKLKARSNPCWV